jgi:hypothetical protein
MNKIIFVLQILLLIGFLSLGFAFFKLYSQTADLGQRISFLENNPSAAPSGSLSYIPNEFSPQNSSFENEIEALKSYVDQSIATVSGKTSSQVTYITKEETSKKTSYITMGDTYSVTSTSWVDIPGSEVYIDLANDYGENATVTWSASLKVAHANGQAFARLYDATNKIAVDGSELTTTNNADYEQKFSGNLPLWRGKNLYKVQLKSLNSFEITYTSGKIKVSYN